MSTRSFGRYLVTGLLGRGGMAEVFQAHDPSLDRRVAIKVIHAHLAVEEGFGERFRREAKLIASLRHPHIVQLHDFDMVDDQPFMVMEYLDGGTLKDRLSNYRARREVMPLDEAAHILEAIADALDYAHARGAVHRDIKPSNILFTADDQPVLADFGIAKILGATLQVSMGGGIIGTPAYMSPEQAAGRPVDARSDLYSLGVLLYEMVTGRVPFHGESPTAVLMQHLSDPVPRLRQYNPKLPEAAEGVILRALAKSPDERFARADDLSRAFREALHGQVSSAISPDAATVVEGPQGEPVTPARPPAPHLHNLPAQPTPFVGREDELAEIAALLREPACRLLTLLGHGGIGKTRLALQSAAEAIELFSHGVWFVPLASLSSADFLVSALVDALKLSFFSGGDSRAQLLNYLRERELLLVMDNFEHLVQGADAIGEVLAVAPGVKFLVTSRERLGLQGEWLLQVEGLRYPTAGLADGLPPTVGRAQWSAVELFVQGARRVYPGFSLSDGDTRHVVRICQLLEGMPLGIELAAAWVRVLSCQEIVGEIEQSRDFLVTSMRDVPERHRSLRAVFEHSWNLLSGDEREVFRRLSVFSGGFRRDAAHRVAGATLPVLATLVDKSLVRRNPSGRYEMHELLRQYAQEKLEEVPEEKRQVYDQHCGYYAAFLQQQDDRLRRGQQKEALEEIAEELQNVRLGWSWAVERGMVEDIGRALESLFLFYEIRGRAQEGEEALVKAVDGLTRAGTVQSGAREPVVIFGRLLARAGALSSRLGHYEEARERLEKGLVVFRQHGIAGETAYALNGLGHIASLLGEYEESRQLFRESLAIYREIGDRQGVSRLLNNLGNVADTLGEHDEARGLLQESLTIKRQVGDQRGVAVTLTNLGTIAFALKQYSEARQIHEESLALYRELGDPWGTAASLSNLGSVACALGEYQESRKCFHEALKLAVEMQAVPLAMDFLLGVATLLIRQGDQDQAVEVLTHILGYPTSWKETQGGAQSLLSELEAQLPTQVFAAARERGKTRALKEMIQKLE